MLAQEDGMHKAQAPLPWREGITTYQRHQSAADDAQALAEAIQTAIRDLHRARDRYEHATRADHDSALWAVRSAEETYGRLMRAARRLGLERVPQVDEPAHFTRPAATIGYPALILAALVLAWCWGDASVHGIIALGAGVAGAVLVGRALRGGRGRG